MAREIDLTSPLTAEEVAWLQARKPMSYVRWAVEQAGLADEPAEASENGPETGSEGDDAGSGPDGADDAGEGDEGSEEDLIGDAPGDENAGNAVGTLYDPGRHTVDEVNKHLKSVSEEERNAILALERDGRNRSSIDGI